MNRRLVGAFISAALLSVACSIACVSAVTSLSGCDSFVGPSTQMGDSYLLNCGGERCDPRYWRCSPSWYPPVHCVVAPVRSSRDAGAE